MVCCVAPGDFPCMHCWFVLCSPSCPYLVLFFCLRSPCIRSQFVPFASVNGLTIGAVESDTTPLDSVAAAPGGRVVGPPVHSRFVLNEEAGWLAVLGCRCDGELRGYGVVRRGFDRRARSILHMTMTAKGRVVVTRRVEVDTESFFVGEVSVHGWTSSPLLSGYARHLNTGEGAFDPLTSPVDFAGFGLQPLGLMGEHSSRRASSGTASSVSPPGALQVVRQGGTIASSPPKIPWGGRLRSTLGRLWPDKDLSLKSSLVQAVLDVGICCPGWTTVVAAALVAATGGCDSSQPPRSDRSLLPPPTGMELRNAQCRGRGGPESWSDISAAATAASSPVIPVSTQMDGPQGRRPALVRAVAAPGVPTALAVGDKLEERRPRDLGGRHGQCRWTVREPEPVSSSIFSAAATTVPWCT